MGPEPIPFLFEWGLAVGVLGLWVAFAEARYRKEKDRSDAKDQHIVSMVTSQADTNNKVATAMAIMNAELARLTTELQRLTGEVQRNRPS